MLGGRLGLARGDGGLRRGGRDARSRCASSRRRRRKLLRAADAAARRRRARALGVEGGLRGLGLPRANSAAVCVGETPEAFARCTLTLLTDDDAWARASAIGLHHVRHVLSPAGQRRAVVDALGLPPELVSSKIRSE